MRSGYIFRIFLLCLAHAIARLSLVNAVPLAEPLPVREALAIAGVPGAHLEFS